MLVCNVSALRPPRGITVGITEAIAADETAIGHIAGIAVEIAEAVEAEDVTSTGLTFATLVDDPASGGDLVDAYLGEVMREAASADATAAAGLAFVSAIDEARVAADTQDSTITHAPIGAIWDSATVAAVTLSGGDLVATNTGTTATNQGAHVAAASGETTGKYYFEVTFTANTGGANRSIGIGTTASTYTNMGNSATTGSVVYVASGNIYSNGSFQSVSIGGGGAGTVYGIAADLDNRKIWFRSGASGNWNNNASYNPATNVGGVTVPAGTMVPFVTFGGGGGAANNVFTANFGNAAFTGAVPSGFTTGWPA